MPTCRYRRAVRQAIHHEEDVMPEIREVSDAWDFSKDGKSMYDEQYCESIGLNWWSVVNK